MPKASMFLAPLATFLCCLKLAETDGFHKFLLRLEHDRIFLPGKASGVCGGDCILEQLNCLLTCEREDLRRFTGFCEKFPLHRILRPKEAARAQTEAVLRC